MIALRSVHICNLQGWTWQAVEVFPGLPRCGLLPILLATCHCALEGRQRERCCAVVQQITIRDALNSALDEEMSRDGDVFILGEEVCPRSDQPLLACMSASSDRTTRAIIEASVGCKYRLVSTRERIRCGML